MNRSEVVDRIRSHANELARFPVESLELFGSTARGSYAEPSDVDILATFRRPPTLREFMGLKFALEEWLGLSVDLVDRAALREGWDEVIREDAILVA